MRYHSTVDIEALISDAVSKLAAEELKIFLLATMAGLRRNEIDKLQWSAFRWNDAVIRIQATEFFAPKTADGEGDVSIDKELLALFRGWHARATSAFVIESDSEPQASSCYTHYRAQRHFDALTNWLRAKGIGAAKPLHELRKEFGSQVCAKYGIYAASRMLRHSRITTTAAHYLDQKEHVTIGLGNLLVMPENVTQIRESRRASRQGARG
jgi:integrase